MLDSNIFIAVTYRQNLLMIIQPSILGKIEKSEIDDL